MSLEREVEGILKLEEDTSKAQTERTARIEALTKKIIKGEGSTGDKIRDFVIVVHHDLSEEAAKEAEAEKVEEEQKEGESEDKDKPEEEDIKK